MSKNSPDFWKTRGYKLHTTEPARAKAVEGPFYDQADVEAVRKRYATKSVVPPNATGSRSGRISMPGDSRQQIPKPLVLEGEPLRVHDKLSNPLNIYRVARLTNAGTVWLDMWDPNKSVWLVEFLAADGVTLQNFKRGWPEERWHGVVHKPFDNTFWVMPAHRPQIKVQPGLMLYSHVGPPQRTYTVLRINESTVVCAADDRVVALRAKRTTFGADIRQDRLRALGTGSFMFHEGARFLERASGLQYWFTRTPVGGYVYYSKKDGLGERVCAYDAFVSWFRSECVPIREALLQKNRQLLEET